IPGLDVSTMEDLRESGRAHRRRQCEDVLRQVRTHDLGNPGPQAVRGLVAVGSRVLGRNRSGVSVTKVTEGVRGDADARTHPEYGFVVEPVRDSQARRQLAFAGIVAAAVDLIRRGIIPFAGPMVAAGGWVDFVPKADIDGELARDLPGVADEQA